MNNLTAKFLTVPFALPVALRDVEIAIYRADDWYQAEVLPLAAHGLILMLHAFVQAIVHTYAAGVKTGRWYRNWFANYALNVPALEEVTTTEPQLLLAQAKEMLSLPAAQETTTGPDLWVAKFQEHFKAHHIEKAAQQVLITPQAMTVSALRKLAAQKGIKGSYSMKKEALVLLLNACE